MNRSVLKEAPQVLCQMLSPFSDDAHVEARLNQCLENSELWDRVIELANRHFLNVTLYYRLDELGLTARLDPQLLDYMRTMADFMRDRNRQIKKQIRWLAEFLERHELGPMLVMKGGATLFQELYPNHGCRFMSDIDLLLPVEEAKRAWSLLEAQGYQGYQTPEGFNEINWDRCQHLSPLFRAGEAAAFEIHVKPLSRLSGGILDSRMLFESASKAAGETSPFLMMSPEHRVYHCFAHSELSHSCFHHNMLLLIQMDYFVRLVHRYQDQLDWQHFVERLDRDQKRAFFSYLYKAQQLFGAEFKIKWPAIAPLERRYEWSLRSCFPGQFRGWCFMRGVYRLKGLFSKHCLQGIYDIEEGEGLLKYRIKRLGMLIGRYKNPYKFVSRIRTVF